jgi:hypothetical protein
VVDAYRFTDHHRRVAQPELSFGDFSPGRVGLALAAPVRLDTPVPFTGKLGFFEVPDELFAGAERTVHP